MIDMNGATERAAQVEEGLGSTLMCPHRPPCPSADAADREAARTVACHPEQGWSLLCNGVVLFDDTGELLPDGGVILPHRPTDIPAVAASQLAWTA